MMLPSCAAPGSRFHAQRRALRCLLLGLLLVLLVAPPAPARQDYQRMSEDEAQELFRSVDQMLKYLAEDFGLPVHGPVKTELTSREDIRRRVEAARSDPENAHRIARQEALLKKKGLLPRDFDLVAFLAELDSEDVLGFYDFRSKTIYVADWLERGRRIPVLMHEVVHAVQDQNVSVTDFLRGGPAPDTSVDTSDEAYYDPLRDDGFRARQAVLEGQAMAAMVDYIVHTVRQRSFGLYDTPHTDVQRALQAAFPRQRRDSLFNQAPLYIRESRAFPYRYGLLFVRELQRRGGSKPALERMLEEPPQSTREIMDPRRFARGEAVPALRPPRLTEVLGKDYELFWISTAGQFDVSVLLREFVGEGTANRVASRWRGGVYYAARRRRPVESASLAPAAGGGEVEAPVAQAVQTISTADLGLLHFSRWENERAARRFADAYARVVEKKYATAEAQPAARSNLRRWRTEEGMASVEWQGDTVLVMESFDEATAERLRRVLLAP